MALRKGPWSRLLRRHGRESPRTRPDRAAGLRVASAQEPIVSGSGRDRSGAEPTRRPACRARGPHGAGILRGVSAPTARGSYLRQARACSSFVRVASRIPVWSRHPRSLRDSAGWVHEAPPARRRDRGAGERTRPRSIRHRSRPCSREPDVRSLRRAAARRARAEGSARCFRAPGCPRVGRGS